MSAKFIQKDGKIYRSFDTAHFQGYILAADLPTGEPHASYKGAPMKWDVLQQVVSWCRAHPSDEVTIRLYRRGDEWKAVPWPQEFPSGMTIRELPDHEMVALAQAEVPDWELAGTVHHHCSSSAFQSGTDSHDEKTKPGLHITLGKVNLPVMDIHARVSVSVPGELDAEGKVVYAAQHAFYGADLAEWIEMPPGCEGVPWTFRTKIIEHTLARLPKGEYPGHWDDRLIRRFQYPAQRGGATGKFYWGDLAYESGGNAGGVSSVGERQAGGAQTGDDSIATMTPAEVEDLLALFLDEVWNLIREYNYTGPQFQRICGERKIASKTEWEFYSAYLQICESTRITREAGVSLMEKDDVEYLEGWSINGDPEMGPGAKDPGDPSVATQPEEEAAQK